MCRLANSDWMIGPPPIDITALPQLLVLPANSPFSQQHHQTTPPTAPSVVAFPRNRPQLQTHRPHISSRTLQMGQIFSHSERHGDSSSSLRRTLSSNGAHSAALKHSISQNMRLSKGKVSSLLKANHMNHSIVHRNYFYNTLPHVSPPMVPTTLSAAPICPSLCFPCGKTSLPPELVDDGGVWIYGLRVAHWSGVFVWSDATEIIRYL